MKDEPRYHVYATHVLDKWENKNIDCRDMILGHNCSYELTSRYIPSDKGIDGLKYWEPMR
jgi:hypothetical protein